MGKEGQVEVAIITYNPDSAILTALLKALKEQTYPVRQTRVVDNGSTEPEKVKGMAGEVEVILLGRNEGFPSAVNRSAHLSTAPYLLILNDDVVPERTAVEEMIKVMESYPDCAAVAPKIYLTHYPGFLDSVGTLVNEHLSAYNRGIGEPDIGQYDIVEKTFGVCFAATLLNRNLFLKMGGLEASFFSYYEDVDWCFRANAAGWHIYTAPSARFFHLHARAWRKENPHRRYFLVQRNLLRTALWNLRPRACLRTICHKFREHFRRFIQTPEYRFVTLQIFSSFLPDVFTFYPHRLRRQKKRKLADHDIFRYSYGYEPHFDPLNYRPLYTLGNLHQAYKRLFEITLKDEVGLKAEALKGLQERSRSLPLPFLQQKLREILKGEPPIIHQFIDNLEPENE